jgi:hypothetical protein
VTIADADVRRGTFYERSGEPTSLVPYPASVLAGDFQLLFGSLNQANGSAITVPPGWTQIAQFAANGGAAIPDIFAAYRNVRADGTEGGSTLSVDHNSVITNWQIYSVGNVDPTTPLDIAAVTVDRTSSNSTSFTSQSLVTAGCCGIFVAAENSSANSSTPPSTWTETADGGGTSRAFTIAFKTGLAAGATGTIANGWSANARNVGILLFLRPAPAAGRASTQGWGIAL